MTAEKGINPNVFPYYEHEFADSSRKAVRALLYALEHLADFRRYFNETWLPKMAETYFADRFPKALPFLPKIRQLPSPDSGGQHG